MATITTFETGYCTHLGCIALKGAAWKTCKFPARASLIDAGGKRWLWDTGYASWFDDYTRRGIYQLYRRVTPVYFSPEQSLVRQLAEKGYCPDDIDALILSHFHADHIAGLRDFADNRFICSGEGWAQTRTLRGFAALRQAFVPGLIPENFESAVSFIEGFERVSLPAALAPFDTGFLLPGSNGEVLLVPLPGHASGHIGAFVLTDNGWVLLAADAAWSPVSYREQRGPSRLANLVIADPAAAARTLDLLHQLWRDGGAEIRLAHEGDL
ncbi:MBL fold metallo-hydrolase [Cronobacter malonaticus]|uniref:MBL fold metallo-hydrolase n=1 Tax=Cronobacter malonaticus TaxID=413503 RepID=UPI0024AF49C7|nr:MBL fold metallo-hydrolase [Cronobacter malonaticus]MDI7688559.1 MBL fold metallo-hydrolase [Cronobacter malonaticus]MDK1299214.1 MBL fold metallo-hydrolase [Cronobacter malonaticus]